MSDERVERKLAAILAADVAGYSRLMGADEAGRGLAAVPLRLSRTKGITALTDDLACRPEAAHRHRRYSTTANLL
jgi:hypothetical protein